MVFEGETWDEHEACVSFTEQVVAESIKMTRLPREREAFLGANIRRLFRGQYQRESRERRGREETHSEPQRRKKEVGWGIKEGQICSVQTRR